jgi:hypothetical protein
MVMSTSIAQTAIAFSAPPRSADRSELTRQFDYVRERRTLRLNYGLVAIIAVTFSTLSSQSAAVTSVQATMDLTRSYSS